VAAPLVEGDDGGRDGEQPQRLGLDGPGRIVVCRARTRVLA
jgi:hypothetical protein